MDLTQQTQLLVNLKQMIEVSHSRGCWKVQEMRDIGVTYNSLCNLLKELENALKKLRRISLDLCPIKQNL